MTVPPDGPADGRAWWRLGLDAHRRPGDGLPDLSRTNPPGLAASTGGSARCSTSWRPTGGYRRERQMLAGFSQGGDDRRRLAFTTDEPIEALVLLSTTFVNEPAWRAGMPRRRGLRVFIAHGRRDDILPFDAAERLQQAMRDAGLQVTWFPFDGGHEMPAEVVTALQRLPGAPALIRSGRATALRRRLARSPRARARSSPRSTTSVMPCFRAQLAQQ